MSYEANNVRYVLNDDDEDKKHLLGGSNSVSEPDYYPKLGLGIGLGFGIPLVMFLLYYHRRVIAETMDGAFGLYGVAAVAPAPAF